MDPTHFGVEVSIDTTKQHTISPYIYGVADAGPVDDDLLRWLGVSSVRWGGNARSRHNWEINASNTGQEGGFKNVSQGSGAPG